MRKAERFFYYALLFEASLGVVGWGIAAYYFSTPKPFLFQLNKNDFYFALFLLLPPLMAAVFLLSPMGNKSNPIQRLTEDVKKNLGFFIKNLSFTEIVALGCAAGIGEEFLFRGALQPMMGIFLSSLIFALLHWVSWVYAFFSFLMSLYLAWVYQKTGNLFVPVFIHAVYDIIIFLVYRYQLNKKNL